MSPALAPAGGCCGTSLYDSGANSRELISRAPLLTQREGVGSALRFKPFPHKLCAPSQTAVVVLYRPVMAAVVVLAGRPWHRGGECAVLLLVVLLPVMGSGSDFGQCWWWQSAIHPHNTTKITNRVSTKVMEMLLQIQINDTFPIPRSSAGKFAYSATL